VGHKSALDSSCVSRGALDSSGGSKGALDNSDGLQGRSGQQWWVTGTFWAAVVGHRGALDSSGGSQGRGRSGRRQSLTELSCLIKYPSSLPKFEPGTSRV
jgi:hypothetical protein